MISTKKVFFGLKGKGNNSKWDRKQTRYFWCTWININKERNHLTVYLRRNLIARACRRMRVSSDGANRRANRTVCRY